MDVPTNITRRTLLRAAPIAAAATAIPLGLVGGAVVASETIAASTSAAAPEPVCDRIDRLTEELSAALAEFQGGTFEAVVRAGDATLRPILAAPDRRRSFHLAEFKRASEELDPMIGHWNDWVDEDTGDWSLRAFHLTGRYQGDGYYESGKPNVTRKYGKWSVELRPGDMIDGQRTFNVRAPGDRLILIESRLETFIGRKLEAL